MRLWPKSLLGQTLLATALALLVAQHLSAYLLFRAAEERRETALVNAAAFHLIGGPRMGGPTMRWDRRAGEEGLAERRRQRGELRRGGMGRGEGRRLGFPRRMHYRLSDISPILAGEARDEGREAALREILARQGVAVAEIAVVERPLARDPLAIELSRQSPRLRDRLSVIERDILVAGLLRRGGDQWEIARVPVPSRGNRVLPVIALQTAVLFVVLMVLLWLVLRRITRPLAALRARTEAFGPHDASAAPLTPSGPSDVSSLIAAHNAMEARIGAMLDEKDVMLGAIGHDLKTPLAALRVRVESVADATQRERMAATIEEVTTTLDEILELARVGRTDATPERAELSALVASVVEEFEDLGEPVELGDAPRIAAHVHIGWLKRGLRNLVANAVRYGGGARVSLTQDADRILLRVEDEGPGIPEDRIAAMIEPFQRGETSRNRTTGGAGLGLALARAVAEQHGGSLVLANRAEGGLRAEIHIPAERPR